MAGVLNIIFISNANVLSESLEGVKLGLTNHNKTGT